MDRGKTKGNDISSLIIHILIYISSLQFNYYLFLSVGNFADQRVRRVQFTTRRRIQISRNAAKSLRMGRIGYDDEFSIGNGEYRPSRIHKNSIRSIKGSRGNVG